MPLLCGAPWPQEDEHEHDYEHECSSESTNDSHSSGTAPDDGKWMARLRRRSTERHVHVPVISITALYNCLQTTGVVVIDCRSEEEFAAGHLAGALHCDPKRTQRRRCRRSVDEAIASAQNEALAHKLSTRDLMEIVVVGGNRSSSPLLYKMDWGYKLARMLVAEGRVFSVRFLAQGAPAFAKKYPFLLAAAHSPKHQTQATQFPNEIVDDFLFLGNFWQANSQAVVRSLRITHVVNLGAITDSRNKFDDVEYLDVAVRDDESVAIQQQFEPCIAFIERAAEAKGRVLIHCVQGISRSSTIVIWYVMLRMKCTLSAAYSYVLKRRPLIFPNRGFMEQLMAHERQLYGAESVSLQDMELLQNGLLSPIDRPGSALPPCVDV